MVVGSVDVSGGLAGEAVDVAVMTACRGWSLVAPPSDREVAIWCSAINT